jgi:hypothetical protein
MEWGRAGNAVVAHADRGLHDGDPDMVADLDGEQAARRADRPASGDREGGSAPMCETRPGEASRGADRMVGAPAAAPCSGSHTRHRRSPTRTSCHTLSQAITQVSAHPARQGEVAMSTNEQANAGAVVPFPARISAAVADADTASIIAVLQDQLVLAREGKLRSVAVVSVSADGEAVGTQWSCKGADITGLIGKLTVLTHDLMAART